MKYDGLILQKHAQLLLKRAASIVASFAFLGVLLGLVAFALIYTSLNNETGIVAGVFASAAVISLFVWYGQTKAFAYRVQAHTALALVEIEANTRKLD
jgi:membrane-bound ClpP family serine protease